MKNNLLFSVCLVFTLLLTLISKNVSASTCAAVFPEVLSSYNASGVANFGYFSRLHDTDGVLDIGIGIDNASQSCNSASCVSSGNPSASALLPSFNYTNSSQD